MCSIPRALALCSVLAAAQMSAAPPAEAAGRAQPSPFAGAFSGPVPPGSIAWGITIDEGGAVRGSYSFSFWGRSSSGSMSGRVSSTGALSCRVEETSTYPRGGGGNQSSVSGNDTITYRTRYEFDATVALDTAGNIVGTSSAGAAFVWQRR